MRAILLSVIFLTACTTTEQAMNTVAQRYVGHSADKFFIENGPPVSSYRLDSGSKIYRWTSGENKVAIPTSNTTHFNAFGPGGTVSGSATTWDSYDVTLACDIEIITNSKNTVKGVRAVRDSAGYWETSRCNEIFSDRAGLQ